MKKLLSRKIKLIRKFLKRYGKRLVSIIFLSSLLLSSVVVKPEVKHVKASAVSGFCSYMSAQAVMTLVTLACSAGGASSSEFLTPSEKAGITDFPSAKNYVHGSLSGNSNFGKIFSFDPVKMVKTECAIASMCLKMGYTLNKSFFDKLWGTYNPDKESWDPEKWGTLTEEEKASYIFSWDKFLEKLNAAGPYPPDPDYDFDDEDEDTSSEYNEKGEHINSSTGEPDVLPVGSLSSIVTSAPFAVISTLAKFMNEDDAKQKFMEKESENKDVCDYSKSYWSSHPRIMKITSPYLVDNKTSYLKFSFKTDNLINSNSPFLYADKIYPLMYTFDNGIYFNFVSNKTVSRYDSYRYVGGIYRVYPSSSYEGSDIPVNDLSMSYYKNHMSFYDSYSDEDKIIDTPLGKMTRDDWIKYVITNRVVINPQNAIVICPNVIDCGNHDNAEKFMEYIQSGDYTLQEILDCMEDGWKADRKKSFESIEDGGETTRKIMESEKGDKYTTKGTKKDSNGNSQTNQRGITYGSVTEGLADGIKGIMGDVVDRTNPIQFPSPKDYPEETDNSQSSSDLENGTGTDSGSDTNSDSKTDSGTDTGTGPGTKPDTEPDTEPSTENPTNEELEDIDPEEVKTPQLLKKFPFCVPWDIVDLVTVFGAEKKAPRFELPFKLNSKQSSKVKIDEKIVIDFSEYETFANICRWFFRLSFIAGLVVLTRYIIKG